MAELGLLTVVGLFTIHPGTGYVLLGLLIGFESSGLPVPGETALIASSILAHQGDMRIEIVILIAASAAIVGDNVGYLIGRRFGRAIFSRPGPFHAHRVKALEKGEGFFVKHGNKSVFLGRWVAGLRVWASWIAGATHMPWRTFLLWNAAGGILWASTVGVAGYLLGHTAEEIFKYGGFAALAIFVVVVLALVFVHRRRRIAHEAQAEAEAAAAP